MKRREEPAGRVGSGDVRSGPRSAPQEWAASTRQPGSSAAPGGSGGRARAVRVRRPFIGHAPRLTRMDLWRLARRSASGQAGERGLDPALARSGRRAGSRLGAGTVSPASGVSTRRWHGQPDERGFDPASARPSTTSGIPDPAWRGRSTRRARSRPAADTAGPPGETAPRSGADPATPHGEPGPGPALTPTKPHGESGLARR